jgi:hypothetical protein
MTLSNGISVGGIGTDDRRDAQVARARKEQRDLAHASYVLGAIRRREAKVAVEASPQVVAVKDDGM